MCPSTGPHSSLPAPSLPHLLGLPQLDLQGPLELLMLLAPPLLVLLQERLGLLLRLPEELQLGHLALPLLLQRPQPLQLLLLVQPPPLALLPLLPALQLQVLVEGALALQVQTDGRLNGCATAVVEEVLRSFVKVVSPHCRYYSVIHK